MKKLKIFLAFLFALVILTGCEADISVPGETGQDIITAKKALKIIADENVIVIDTQKSRAYKDQHLRGAVNIGRNDVTVLGPFPNMLAPASKVEKSLGENGVSNATKILIYDNNNNMDAARLWWTLLVYGHSPTQMQVISGGLQALQEAGGEITDRLPEITAAEYKIESKNTELIADKAEVLAQANNPQENVAILDVRTQAEVSQGIVPGAIHLNYVENINDKGEYYPVSYMQRLYPDHNLTPDKTIIMYCQTSIRAAQTFLALHNAGYRDLKLYDGAWIEWSSDSSTPKAMPSGAPAAATKQDAS
ncbi:rhodanese-like domain-containing protein [Halanaerobium salsuginis]|uniref:thiosulfate sulfurtransferase n=1 Tax=Halanaerobium salsuginis TaxID=29563 RepID=A0A1I4H3H1_9FIRM|nr:rhodanese-like domain-containing protein [Halanaerobium salsuginis]SFL36828.1 thiosulfate/3-mercaptopyruvate sulfurtransferase [Halanaerobium salsuginis]